MINKIINFFRYVFNLLFAIYRDVYGVYLLIKMKQILKKFDTDNTSLGEEFRKLAENHPTKPCILYEDETWTFNDVIY